MRPILSQGETTDPVRDGQGRGHGHHQKKEVHEAAKQQREYRRKWTWKGDVEVREI